MDRLGEAYAFAARAHEGQTRPAGEPYPAHLLEVLQILVEGASSRDVDQLVAALLHDVVEDTPVTSRELRQRFGNVVAELVGWVTMPLSDTGDRAQVRLAYLEHLRQAPSVVRRLKLADRYSNVQRLDTHPRPQKRRSYFEETVRHVVPLTIGDPFFEPLFTAWQRRMSALV
jgi:(p)ppGpp synthase/HD superfamily hydrolase